MFGPCFFKSNLFHQIHTKSSAGLRSLPHSPPLVAGCPSFRTPDRLSVEGYKSQHHPGVFLTRLCADILERVSVGGHFSAAINLDFHQNWGKITRFSIMNTGTKENKILTWKICLVIACMMESYLGEIIAGRYITIWYNHSVSSRKQPLRAGCGSQTPRSTEG